MDRVSGSAVRVSSLYCSRRVATLCMHVIECTHAKGITEEEEGEAEEGGWGAPSMGVCATFFILLTRVNLLSLICRQNLWSVGMPHNKR